MARPKDETDELKRYCLRLGLLEEAGAPYYLLEGLRLPVGCQPQECDALLCPVTQDGYSSRLYFSSQITSAYARNWNGSVRIGERNWYAFSWHTNAPSTARLAELLLIHLGGFTKEK